MMKTMIPAILCALVLVSSSSAAFVGSNGVSTLQRSSPWTTTVHHTPTRNIDTIQRNMLPDGSFLSDSITSMASNMWLSTIDSDIANIPENEFAPVFFGGLVVMFGGVASALIVGYILDSKNLYANVVADSYAQGGEDEDFWKGLSDEEKKKTRELIDKLNAKKAAENGVPAERTTVEAVSAAKPTKTEEAVPATGSPELDMFSDYADATDAGKK